MRKGDTVGGMNWITIHLGTPSPGVLRVLAKPWQSIALASLAAACGGSHGTMRTDTPVLPYQKPDISEITGIPEEDSDAVAPDPAPVSQPVPSASTPPPAVQSAPAAAIPAGKAPASPKK